MLRVLGSSVRQPKFMAPEQDMSGKIVAITGPTRGGIGFETALGLAKMGASLILMARRMNTAEEAEAAILEAVPGAIVKKVECDVSELDSVNTAANEVHSICENVDVLICNAGAMFPKLQKTSQGVEMTFAVCVLGHHKLIHSLMPKRLVWVTGEIYALSKQLPNPFSEEAGYQAYMKACLSRLLLTKELKRRNTEAGLEMEIVSVHPGVISSRFSKLSGLAQRAAEMVLISPMLGAQASIYTASAPKEEIHQQDELPYYHNKTKWMTLDSKDLAMNDEAAKALFDQCDEIAGISRTMAAS